MAITSCLPLHQEKLLLKQLSSLCFKKYFIQITGLLSQSQYKNRPIMPELFAAMLSILEFTSDYYDVDINGERKKILDWFLPPFFDSMKKKDFSKFANHIDARREFYLNYSRSIPLRGEFMLNELPDFKKNWPPYRYSVIFCDCVFNSECMTNYNDAPVVLNSIFDKASEQSSLWIPIMNCFDSYSRDIKDILIN